MSKRVTKILSLILTLVMFLSVSTPAFALGGDELGEGWDREIGEDEVLEAHDTVEEAEEELDYFQALDEDSGVQVTVEAPLGALPTLAEVRADRVEAEDVREAVNSVVEGNPQILLALDISFWLNGREIEPEDAVRVKISAPELEDKTNLTLVHIPDEAEPETVDLLPEEDLEFALGSNEIVFESDSFSTYVITWGEEPNAESATVHWGQMNGETFEEFDMANVVTLDTSADVISLAVDFEGKVFTSATYKPAEGDEIAIGSTLKKVDGKWQVETRVMNSETGELESVWINLNDGDEIFVVYTIPSEGSTPGEPQDPSKVPTPDTQKKVLVNADGTRTVVLDVTGTKVTEDNSFGANVLIVLDRTASMGIDMPNSTMTRWAAAKSAINTLVTTLSTGENAGNDIEFGLLDFVCPYGYNNGNSTNLGSYYYPAYYYIQDTLHHWNTAGAHANSGSYWTKNATAYNTNFIQQSNFTHPEDAGGTNWQAALRDTQTMLAANARDDDMTYVIFLTDGEPSIRGLTSTNLSTSGNLVNPALTEARTIVAMPNVKFYGVFVGDSSGYTTLNGLVTSAGGVKTINGTSSSAMQDEFAKIAQTIINDLYANNVSVDDGVPSLSSVSSGVVEGGVGGYEYYKVYPLTAASGGSYTYKVGDQTKTVTAAQISAGKDADGNLIYQEDGKYYIEVKWTENIAGASYNESNGVTWNLSSVDVQPGVTYRLKFKVWPSQEAYDYIADLNNGLVDPMPDEDELLEMGIDKNDEGIYYLLTNTHLKTTYSFKDETYVDEPEETPTSEMILPTTPIKITKIWNNELDAREASDVRLEVTKDGEPYLYDDEDAGIATAIPMTGAVKTGPNQWTQTNDTDIYISMGQLTRSATKNNDDTYDIEVISSGHDYTVIEPENFSYRWDLSADIYHPMVINGEPVVLIEVTKEAKAELPDAVKNLAQNKHIASGGKDYYAFHGELYVAQAGSNVLTAINDRRSNLIINKVVEETNAPADDVFAIKVTLDNPNDPHPGEEGYSDWYHTMWFYVSTEANNRDTIVILEDDQVEGATREVGGDPEGYWWFDNGGTVTVYLKAGQYLNFNNMGRGTNYTIEELDGEKMPEGYIFDKAETAADNKVQGETSTPGTVDTENPRKVTGTIDKPNTDYTVTYTNKYLGVFYVYHSSDLSVERFPMAVNGVAYKAASGDDAAVTFDIYALKKDGTLYGGYYSDYAGKSDGFDAAAAAALFEGDGDKIDADGMAYTYQAIKDGVAWSYDDGFDTIGTAMVPVSNTVYYLKEVPTGYLMPYTHYTYYKDESKYISSIWTISATDDLNYQKAGFVVVSKDMQAIMLKEMVIKAEHSTSSVTLTAAKVFKTKGVLDGYLGYADIDEFKTQDNVVMIRQYWTTKDGIQEFGVKMRQLSFGNCSITGLSKTDKDYEPLNAEP